MPRLYKGPYKRRMKRRTRGTASKGRHKRYRKKGALVISKVPGTLGLAVKQTLKYCDTFQLVSTIGLPDTFSLCINDLYDPQFAVGGHQPIGFDNLMQFYNHFTVTKARLKVTFVNEGASQTQSNSVVGIELSGNPTPTTAINDIYEQGHSNYKVTTWNEGKPIIVKKVCDISKFLNQDVLDEDSNAGSVTSRPDELVFMHIFNMNVDPGTNQTGNITCLVELVQEAVFHEPKPLIGS